MGARTDVVRRLCGGLIGALLILTTSLAAADTFVVEAGCNPLVDPCDCAEIQPCIDMAAAGDTVLVLVGIYTAQETRTLSAGGQPVDLTANVFMRDGVHLIGTGSGFSTANGAAPDATIDAGGNGSAIIADGISAGTVLDRFVIRGGNAVGSGYQIVGGGMLCLDSELTIRNCVFSQNHAWEGGGLAAEDDSSPLIDGNLFSDNQAGHVGGAIFCNGCGAIITNNVIEANQAPEGAAIRYIGSGTIAGNTLRSNLGTGLLADLALIGELPAGVEMVVEDNLFHDNTSAIFMITSASTIVGQNTMIRGQTGIQGLDTSAGVQLIGNLVVSQTVAGISWEGGGPLMECNDVWQNGINYDGLRDPTGTLDNISADPLHCAPGQDIFTIAENSPCAPALSGCGTLIGAGEVDCPPSTVEATTWGAIKASYGR